MFKNAIAIACAAVLFTGQVKAESPIQLTEMSGRLFEQGIETLDPILMIAAAKIRKSLALEKDKATATDDQIVSWQDMLDTAIAAAPDDAQIAALVDDVRAESSKGVSTGQVYSITTLRGGGTDVYPALPYKGGDYAEVYVEGTGRADLNVYVTDSKGRLVCSDTDISAIAYCGWRPAHNDTFVIKVRNKGGASSKYSLITN